MGIVNITLLVGTANERLATIRNSEAVWRAGLGDPEIRRQVKTTTIEAVNRDCDLRRS